MAERPKRKSSGRRSLNALAVEEFKSDEEILGFPPLDVIDDIINSVHDSACDIVDETEERVCKKFPDHIEKLQHGFDNFLDLWAPALDKYCDKFELFALNNSFHITPEVRKLVTQEQNRKQAKPELKQDTDESFYEQQQKELDNQIFELQKQLIEQRNRNATLESGLHQIGNNLPQNLEELSLHIDNHPLPVDKILPAIQEIKSHYNQLQNVFQSFRNEINNLPPIPEKQTDIESKFKEHSQQSNIQSIGGLEELTDAMDE